MMASELLAYVRVSSSDQNPGRQIEKMRALGVDERRIFVEKASGKDFDRNVYQLVKMIIHKDDVLFIDSLDRLGRNYDGIIREWKEITRDIGADIVALDKADLFDSRKFKAMGDIGKLLEDQMLSMMSYVAEQERLKNKQRQKEGIAIAKREGKYKGRKPVPVGDMFFAVTKMWVDGQIGLSEAQKRLDMAPATFFRKCKEYGIKKQNNSPSTKRTNCSVGSNAHEVA